MEKRKWTDNDRNMSHFFMKAYTNFATYGYVIIILIIYILECQTTFKK